MGGLERDLAKRHKTVDEFARTFIRTTDSVSGDEVRVILDELGVEARGWLEREGIPKPDQRLVFNVDMRYYRQGYEIPVEIEPSLLAGNGTTMLAERFNQLHEQFYGFRMEESACEIVNLRAIGYGKVPEPHLPEGEPGAGDSSGAVVDEHEVYFHGEWLPTRVYDRARLRPGHRLEGPAIVTEFDSTTVVLPGYRAAVDETFNILITPNE